MKRRNHSFVWSGIVAIALLILGITRFVETSDASMLFGCIAVSIMSFTLISCLILDNNFIGEMISAIFGWGFVTMPGLIFTLDLDGIIWFLTVKLLFWILGIVLAILCGLLGIFVGLVMSLFVYPYALYQNIKHGEEDD